MIVDERMIAYIRSLDQDEAEDIHKIEKQAVAAHIPIIRQETKGLLKVLLRMAKPKKLLEAGTAVGFSAVFMSEYIGKKSTITTIEKCPERIAKARANFKALKKDNQITLLEGDALEILKQLKPEYDFIFMDAAKGQYLYLLPEVLRLLAPGGTIVSDNVLQDGDIVESRFAITRRNRTIHSRMREYLWQLKHMETLETVILPIGDGVAVSTKAEETGSEET